MNALSIHRFTTETGIGPEPAISQTSPSIGWPRHSAGRSTRTMILASAPAGTGVLSPFEESSSTAASKA
jgi:hypothetical protein